MTLIKDGSTGLVAKVLEGGLLRVTPEERVVLEALKGNGWFLNPSAQARTLSKTAANETIVLMQNPPASGVTAIVHKITVSYEGSGGISSNYTLVAANTIGTIGANTPAIFRNREVGSAITPKMTGEIWDETAGGLTGLTNGVDVTAVTLQQGQTALLVEDIVMLPGTNISIDGDGGAQECSFSIEFYEIADLAALTG